LQQLEGEILKEDREKKGGAFVNEEFETYRKDYALWAETYKPEFVEFDKEGGPNWEKVKALPEEFVWTEYGTPQDNRIAAGFHFFGDDPLEDWPTFGWHISKISNGYPKVKQIEILAGLYSECDCYDEDTEEGNSDCGECGGEGHRDYFFHIESA
jgi:hypothetical protein